jgi:hypothetical protein
MEMHIWVEKVSNGFIVRWGQSQTISGMPACNVMVLEQNSLYLLANQIERNILKELVTDKDAE